jgi:hypothetical protein
VLRIYATKSVYAKWLQLCEAEHQQLWRKFLSQCSRYDNSYGLLRTDLDSFVFEPKPCLIELPDIAPVHLSCRFSQFLAGAMRKHQPVRGELELAAEFANRNYPSHALEVPCAVGRIDILVPRESLIIEAKLAGSWKHAVGQALCYRECLNSDQGGSWSTAVLLLGLRDEFDYRLISLVCDKLDVKVFWYSGQ